MSVEATRVRHGRVGTLRLQAYPTTEAMGQAAAAAAANEMLRLSSPAEPLSIIFATGASQLATLDALTMHSGLPWNHVSGFHLDEYIGLPISHPASFRGYLRRELTGKVPMKEFFEIDGTALDPQQACAEYAARLPGRAITVTIPAIMKVPTLILSVPGIRKAAILRRTLEEPISTECPATILREHPNATLYLDAESASELDEYLTAE